MPSVEQTVEDIANAPTVDARIAEIRKVPGKHGVDDHQAIFAEVARRVYVPHLAPNFAFIDAKEYFSPGHFVRAYRLASAGTAAFTKVDVGTLTALLLAEPHAFLVLRTMTGLTRDEFSVATKTVDPAGDGVGKSSMAGMEEEGRHARGQTQDQRRASILAETVGQLMNGTLFVSTDPALPTKQEFQTDTARGWGSVARFASGGVPYEVFLHQRHYGGYFRQILDSTSSQRGDQVEEEVVDLFESNGIPHIRTGAHNQGDPYKRFGLETKPAPDFVIYSHSSGHIQAILECKTINDGGTARDKAMRFHRLKNESMRLGGIPVIAVLGGLGWRRANDALGPVVEATDGRVFTLSTLPDMLTTAPFPSLLGTAP